MAISLFRAGFLHSTRLPNRAVLTGGAPEKISVHIKSLISYRAQQFSGLALLPKALNGSSSLLRRISTYCTPTEEEIVSISLDAIQASPPNIETPKIPCSFVFDHPKVKAYPYVDKFRVITRVLDGVSTYPQIDTTEVFQMRCTVRGMLYLPENVKDLTREQVTSRVLEVLKICPFFDSSKVNEDAHFEQDLGLDLIGRHEIVAGLQYLFRIHDIHPLHVYFGFKTVKQAVDYFCSHLHETWIPEDSSTGIHQDCMENFRLKEYDLYTTQQNGINGYIYKYG